MIASHQTQIRKGDLLLTKLCFLIVTSKLMLQRHGGEVNLVISYISVSK